ncbi:uncharacterized protein [Dermacentor andersoni]|uniref:uncharacterized protein n=1 Tax=Dermacentor andersoni TaxID=34620 RepID=UPI003B3AD9A0
MSATATPAGPAGRRASRSVSKRRASESRQRSLSRKRSQSRDRVSWADAAKHGAKKAQGGATTTTTTTSNTATTTATTISNSKTVDGNNKSKTREDEAMRMLQEDNEALRRKNNELETKVSWQEATISKMANEIMEIKKLLTTRSTNNETPQAVSCEPTPSISSALPSTSAEKEPAPKRRAIENLKERKLNDRVDNLKDKVDQIEEHLDGLEDYIKTTFTTMINDSKKVVLQQHITQVANKPDIIMIQETRTDTVSLPGYRVYAKSPKVSGGRGICTLVRKGLTFIEHELHNSKIEYTLIEVVTGKKQKNSTFLLNVYSSPSHWKQKFKTLLHRASTVAGTHRLVACGDFNAAHPAWGYNKQLAKGRDLFQDTLDLGFTLITDPTDPTRIGNSVSRDTTPDLTFVKNDEKGNISWRNTGSELGSDHYIVEVIIPEEVKASEDTRKHYFTDWDAFRSLLPTEMEEINNIEEWSAHIAGKVKEATKIIETDEQVDKVDSRLAHLFEAKQSIINRWKKQRLNRRLRKKVAELNRAIEVHCRLLCTQQWNEICNAADGQMHSGKTWNLMRHLLDKTKTKSHQRDRLAKIIHRAVKENGETEVIRRINSKYLPVTPTERHPEYGGQANEKLDRDISVEEVRAALHELNSKSAAGPDHISNRALKNLSDVAIENLTGYYNKCWSAGSLPQQWKTAKTILIPKPGKPPNTDNLRPISLTSCVGKVLEHVLMCRWQDYLEESGLYPTTIIGFRRSLGTQDAMILLKKDIIDEDTLTKDNKAILGLDLQSAFDKVKHSAILAQVSRLNMGARTYNYIKDFLTGRTTELCAGDLRLQEKRLGSVGTPQGSVISPLLFNLVMIGVAKRLSRVEGVRHTIYADDITLWVPGGSDGHIESTLQEAVDAIEDQLNGSGLICSPSKSELLVLPPKYARRKKSEARDYEAIKIVTRNGHVIPEVDKIRVLGMIIDKRRGNGETISRLTAKITNAIRLIRRVANRKAGMKEESLIRLVHSFVISHVTYVAAFHNWMQCERNKIDALIRRAYKAALGLLECTSTNKLLSLGVHNTLDEIAEAQRTAQLERLSMTEAGRRILQYLGFTPGAKAASSDVSVPDGTRRRIRVDLIPRNMNPEYNKERRAARAKALIDFHAKDEHARFVDAAEYQGDCAAFVATVIEASSGATRAAASLRVREACQAEEVAIALAIADPGCQTVLCDSRSAVRNYAKGKVCGEAVRVLCSADLQRQNRCVRIKWFPAHAGNDASEKHDNHNETAHAVARALTNRAAATDRPTWCSAKDRMTTFNELTQFHRLARRTFPPPHPGLSRAEAVLFRQLQTGSLPTPVLMTHLYPKLYVSDVCRVCQRERATLTHILWDCTKFPNEASTSTTIPPRLAAAAECYDHESQTWAVQQVSEAERNRRNVAPQGDRPRE